jgi:hypothetical protein
MATDLRDLALAPRAAAAVLCLRRGPRTVRAIADAIADRYLADTVTLMELLANGVDGRKLVQSEPVRSYGLTHDGIGWLQSQGLDATPAAKQALYAAAAAPDLVPGGAL